MRWFVSLLFVCISLLTGHAVWAADHRSATAAAGSPSPMRPWAVPPAPDWWPPPPLPGAAAESAEIDALRERVQVLRSELAARGMSLEGMQGQLFSALRDRDHWWAQVQWLWELGRRNSALAWRRIVELESALAQANRGGSAMAQALVVLRARVQATEGELMERAGRIRVMEQEQVALKAARDSLLAENTQLRNDLNRVRDQLAQAADGASPEQEGTPSEGGAVELAALETEPPWHPEGPGQRPTPTKLSPDSEVAGLPVISYQPHPRAMADDLHAMRMDRDYLEARLQAVLSEREALAGSLSSARLTLRQSMEEAEAKSAETSALQSQAAALQDRLQRAGEQLAALARQRERDQERIDALQTENARLLKEQFLERAAQTPVTRLDAKSREEMIALRQAIAALESNLSLAKAQKLPSASREADPATVQARAAELGNSYELVYTGVENQESTKTGVIADLERLSDDLFREQSLLARTLAANGVYKVLPHDSLSRIAYKVYGTSKRWPDIYSANDHLLKNPDALLPGLVLVIP